MRYFDLLSKLDAQARFLGILSVFLAGALLLMTFAFLKLYTSKTVVILPPRVDKEFWVSGDTLSTSYLEQVAYFIADRFLSVSPESVDRSLDMIKPFFSTDTHILRKLDEYLVRYAKTIKEEDLYQVFYPLQFFVDKEKSKLVVVGNLHKISGGQYLGEESVNLSIEFYVKNGRFFVKGISLE